MKSAAALSRRSLLGLAVLGLAACKKGSSASPPRLDPDASAIAAARTSELTLLGATTDVAARSLHLAHLAALGGSRSGSPSASPTPPASTRSLLRSSAASLRAAAVSAVDGAHAALFASIAASHEVAARD